MVQSADIKTFADGTATMRPVCSKCGAPLWLTRIEPDKPSFARRTFECPRCQSRISEVVELKRLPAESSVTASVKTPAP
jgi:DNA-directed RNA polymerase subunit RPC12/RpoP